MITLHEDGISYSGKPLFSDVSFFLGNGDRLGLVGKNGTGKTTLLKMLKGELPPTEGEISFSNEL
ncbi:MAG: ATP-binding cassette domain-containing protein, partial [Flavobacteriales bacterium]